MGRTDKLVALAGFLLGIGGAAAIEFAPEAYRKYGWVVGLTLILIGSALFIWAVIRKKSPSIIKEPHPHAAIDVRGDDAVVHGNRFFGYENPIRVEGARSSIQNNSAHVFPPRKPPSDDTCD